MFARTQNPSLFWHSDGFSSYSQKSLYLLCCIGRLLHVVLLALELGVHGVDGIFIHQLGVQRQSFHHLHVQVRQLRVLPVETNGTLHVDVLHYIFTGQLEICRLECVTHLSISSNFWSMRGPIWLQAPGLNTTHSYQCRQQYSTTLFAAATTKFGWIKYIYLSIINFF